jgi:hypothetical protein
MTTQTIIHRLWALMPVLGTALFAVLYFIATFYYPGGSQFDKNSVGFSWINNYWCNLINTTALNGQPNEAQPFALTAMFILCASLIAFWLRFPEHTRINIFLKRTIQVCGTLSMIIGFFLFTAFDHDLITNLASLFGLIAATGTLIGLLKNSWYTLFRFGLLNMLLIVLNTILYYDKHLIFYLPLVQKLTFATFLVWICLINLKMHQPTKDLQRS